MVYSPSFLLPVPYLRTTKSMDVMGVEASREEEEEEENEKGGGGGFS